MWLEALVVRIVKETSQGGFGVVKTYFIGQFCIGSSVRYKFQKQDSKTKQFIYND